MLFLSIPVSLPNYGLGSETGYYSIKICYLLLNQPPHNHMAIYYLSVEQWDGRKGKEESNELEREF